MLFIHCNRVRQSIRLRMHICAVCLSFTFSIKILCNRNYSHAQTLNGCIALTSFSLFLLLFIVVSETFFFFKNTNHKVCHFSWLSRIFNFTIKPMNRTFNATINAPLHLHLHRTVQSLITQTLALDSFYSFALTWNFEIPFWKLKTILKHLHLLTHTSTHICIRIWRYLRFSVWAIASLFVIHLRFEMEMEFRFVLSWNIVCVNTKCLFLLSNYDLSCICWHTIFSNYRNRWVMLR